VREGGAPKSQGVSGVRARVTLPDPSQGPGELFARGFSCACEGFTTCFFRVL
jgi:hypothetical protein